MSRKRILAVLSALGVVIVVGLISGVHRLDPATQFGVREGRFWPGDPEVYEQRTLVFVPPGAFRFTAFPRVPTELPLPRASDAMLESADGGRFGLVGKAVVRALPERAKDLVTAAAGKGIDGVLLAAVRASGYVVGDADRDDRSVSPRVLALEKRLRSELEARGATLESLKLVGFDDLLAKSSAAPVPPDVKVLLVGLDGADWRIVDPLMAAGHLPNLQRLVTDGVRADLRSISPMLSPVIWTSIATGVEPQRHGVMDFLAAGPSGRDEPVTSAARRVPTVWEILSDAGVRVGITGWWATWPADPVNGYMITDRLAYQLFGFASDPRSAAGKTWPASIYGALSPLIVPTDAVTWNNVLGYLDGPRRRADEYNDDERQRLDGLRTLLAAGKTYLDVALAMRKRDPVQFESVYFEGTDTVGHLFMPFRAPQLSSVDAKGFASFHAVVDRYYENADSLLGKLLEGRDGWTVIVVSDHGFASDATRPMTTDSRIGHGAAADWHRRFGIFVMRGPGVKRGVRLDQASVYDIAPTVLALFHQPVPRSWPGRVLGRALAPELFAANPVRLRADDPVRRGGGEPAPADQQESNELREKLQSLGYVSATAPQSMTTSNNQGLTLLGDRKYTEAAAFFRQALAAAPTQPTLMVNLGIALRFAGEKREAKELLLRAFGTTEARRSAGTQLAQIAMEDTDLAGAERILRSVLLREPGAPEIYNLLGLVLEKQARFPEAVKAYAESSRLDSNFAEPRNNLGNLARRDRHDDDAERWYLDAIASDPYFMGAYNNLALLCQARGQIDRAIDLYGRALAKAPANAVVMNNLASLYFATGDNRSARALWRQAIEADPKYASPLNNLAGMALGEEDDATAEGLLDRALSLDPNYGDAHINKALVARRRGDNESARRELHEAVKDERAAGTAHMHLALIDLDERRPGQAIEELDAARKLLGDRTDILNALGESYARLLERPKALAVLKRSLELDPKQDQVRAAVATLEKQ